MHQNKKLAMNFINHAVNEAKLRFSIFWIAFYSSGQLHLFCNFLRHLMPQSGHKCFWVYVPIFRWWIEDVWPIPKDYKECSSHKRRERHNKNSQRNSDIAINFGQSVAQYRLS